MLLPLVHLGYTAKMMLATISGKDGTRYSDGSHGFWRHRAMVPAPPSTIQISLVDARKVEITWTWDSDTAAAALEGAKAPPPPPIASDGTWLSKDAPCMTQPAWTKVLNLTDPAVAQLTPSRVLSLSAYTAAHVPRVCCCGQELRLKLCVRDDAREWKKEYGERPYPVATVLADATPTTAAAAAGAQVEIVRSAAVTLPPEVELVAAATEGGKVALQAPVVSASREDMLLCGAAGHILPAQQTGSVRPMQSVLLQVSVRVSARAISQFGIMGAEVLSDAIDVAVASAAGQEAKEAASSCSTQ